MNALILLAAAAGGHPLEPVIVTATRTESPAAEVLASVDIIRGDELLRQPAADLGDALRMVPGVEVARLGGPGQQTSLFLRGTESNHVLVLVDGLRINPGTIGSAAIQNIAPEFVERVEVVKGPRSTLYGSDAIGGVINVITRRAADDGGSVQAGFGSYDTQSASFSAGAGSDRAEASIAASWLDSAGFPTRTGDTTDRGYENSSFTAAARADAGPVELGLRAWHASGTSEYSDFFVTPVDQDFENSALTVSAGFAPSAAWSSRLTIGHAVDELEQNQSPDFLDTRRCTVDWQNDVALSERQTLTAGLLWQDEKADAESFGLPYRPTRRRARSICRTRPRPARTGCCSAPPTRITRPSAATRPGTPSTASDSPAARSSAGGGHGISSAGCDRSLRLRRQSGPRPGGIAELRAELSPAHRRAPVLSLPCSATTSTA